MNLLDQLTPLLDLAFVALALLAMIPLVRVIFLAATAHQELEKSKQSPDLKDWKRDVEALMSRASIVPLRRQHRRKAMSERAAMEEAEPAVREHAV